MRKYVGGNVWIGRVRKNYISVAVISLHKIEVTTARADGKAPHVICVYFADRLLPNVQFFSREDRIWCKKWGSGFRLCWVVVWFGRAHYLPSL